LEAITEEKARDGNDKKRSSRGKIPFHLGFLLLLVSPALLFVESGR